MWYAERSAMPVMMPGSAIGRIEQQRDRVAAEEPGARQRRRGQRAQHQGDRRGPRRDLEADSLIAAHTSSRCQATPNHCVVSAGGGKT